MLIKSVFKASFCTILAIIRLDHINYVQNVVQFPVIWNSVCLFSRYFRQFRTHLNTRFTFNNIPNNCQSPAYSNRSNPSYLGNPPSLLSTLCLHWQLHLLNLSTWKWVWKWVYIKTWTFRFKNLLNFNESVSTVNYYKYCNNYVSQYISDRFEI